MSTSASCTATVASVSQSYLTFELDELQYAISVDFVREIITSINVTPVPGSPNYLTGVTSLRGHILPVVNLRQRLRMHDRPAHPRDCYLVLILQSHGQTTELAVRVDGVGEVMKFAPSDIDPAPQVGNGDSKLVFSGVARTAAGVRLILDIGSLVSQLLADIQSPRVHSTATPWPSVKEKGVVGGP